MLQEYRYREQIAPLAREEDIRKFEFFINGNLNPHWVSDYAEKLAIMLSRERPTMTINQLRAFFSEFLRIRDIASNSDNERKILIKMLEVKAVYRSNSSSAKIPELFSLFMTKLVRDIGDSVTNFRQSISVMEALVGYFPKSERR